jgi:hypothetical protein
VHIYCEVTGGVQQPWVAAPRCAELMHRRCSMLIALGQLHNVSQSSPSMRTWRCRVCIGLTSRSVETPLKELDPTGNSSEITARLTRRRSSVVLPVARTERQSTNLRWPRMSRVRPLRARTESIRRCGGHTPACQVQCAKSSYTNRTWDMDTVRSNVWFG